MLFSISSPFPIPFYLPIFNIKVQSSNGLLSLQRKLSPSFPTYFHHQPLHVYKKFVGHNTNWHLFIYCFLADCIDKIKSFHLIYKLWKHRKCYIWGGGAFPVGSALTPQASQFPRAARRPCLRAVEAAGEGHGRTRPQAHQELPRAMESSSQPPCPRNVRSAQHSRSQGLF